MFTVELSAGAIFALGVVAGVLATGILIVVAAAIYSKKSK